MHTSLVIVEGGGQLEVNPDCQSFWNDNEVVCFIGQTDDAKALLKSLTFKVSRNPADLLAHLRRIYCCYQNRFSQPLYAALLDLLIVLNGKGQQLSRRLIQGSASVLEANVVNLLKRSWDNPNRLPGNDYCLFSNGVVGRLHLVDYQHHGHVDRDFIALAHDFIEYSQLEEAMDVLEQGLLIDSKSEDAQNLLLQLYRSTHSQDRFYKQYKSMSDLNANLSEGWVALQRLFDGEKQ